MKKTVGDIKKERMERVREMYLQNMTITEISKELGCGLSTVSEYVKEMGIKKSKTKEDRIKVELEILRLHTEDLNDCQIAQKVGCSQSWVNKILRKNGIWRKKSKYGGNLADTNIRYAKDIVLEKIMIGGKLYTDITPIFAPR